MSDNNISGVLKSAQQAFGASHNAIPTEDGSDVRLVRREPQTPEEPSKDGRGTGEQLSK